MTFLDTLCVFRFLLWAFLSTLLAFLIMGYSLFMIFIVMGLFVHYAVLIINCYNMHFSNNYLNFIGPLCDLFLLYI